MSFTRTLTIDTPTSTTTDGIITYQIGCSDNYDNSYTFTYTAPATPSSPYDFTESDNTYTITSSATSFEIIDGNSNYFKTTSNISDNSGTVSTQISYAVTSVSGEFTNTGIAQSSTNNWTFSSSGDTASYDAGVESCSSNNGANNVQNFGILGAVANTYQYTGSDLNTLLASLALSGYALIQLIAGN